MHNICVIHNKNTAAHHWQVQLKYASSRLNFKTSCRTFFFLLGLSDLLLTYHIPQYSTLHCIGSKTKKAISEKIYLDLWSLQCRCIITLLLRVTAIQLGMCRAIIFLYLGARALSWYSHSIAVHWCFAVISQHTAVNRLTAAVAYWLTTRRYHQWAAHQKVYELVRNEQMNE